MVSTRTNQNGQRIASDETFFHYRTAVGTIAISASSSGLTRIHFPRKNEEENATWMDGLKLAPCALTNEVSTQLMEYLAGKRRAFDVPLDPAGSEFQLKVWDAIKAIPYGSTLSCGKLAALLGNKNLFRSVGIAANACPLPIVIPVHRLVGSNGVALGQGIWAARNQILIEFERMQLQRNQ